MEQPGIHMEDYGLYTVTVHLQQRAGPGTKWQIETEVRKGNEVIGKRHPDGDNRWDDYHDARSAGLEEGQRRIASLIKNNQG